MLQVKKDITTNKRENVIYIKTKDYYPFEEERRLFYVALTRTKNKVYILGPNKKEKKSEFVIEIEKYNNVIKRKEII